MANDFLTFAGGGGANVLTQSAYAALAARTSGFVAGTAKSQELNKVWRQSSIMAAVLAQTIANRNNGDAIDDGTTATLITNLAKTLASFSPPVGYSRNAKMAVVTASATATFTADELVLETALGGTPYRLSSISKTINLATTGVGGMDTGTAPATGYVGIYVIYNPSAPLSASNPGLLAVNAATVLPEVYGGANMPAGYTASALVAVVPTDGSSRIVPLYLTDRGIDVAYRALIATSTIQATLASFSASAVPLNAKRMGILVAGLSTAQPATIEVIISTRSSALGSGTYNVTNSIANRGFSMYGRTSIETPQTLFYQTACNNGTPTFNAGVIQYEF